MLGIQNEKDSICSQKKVAFLGGKAHTKGKYGKQGNHARRRRNSEMSVALKSLLSRPQVLTTSTP